MGLKFKLLGRRKFEARMQAEQNAKISAITKAVARGAQFVHADAVRSVQRGPKTGEIYGRHQASAPGEAPATDTGNLASNILVDIIPGSVDIEAKVISRAPYSIALEFGTKNMEPRPFMRPAFEKNKKRIQDLIARMVRDA